jgi:hypothetical protein
MKNCYSVGTYKGVKLPCKGRDHNGKHWCNLPGPTGTVEWTDENPTATLIDWEMDNLVGPESITGQAMRIMRE